MQQTKGYLNQYKEQLIADYLAGINTVDLYSKYGTNRVTFFRFLKRNGVKADRNISESAALNRSHGRRRYSCNHEFFDVDTFASAYWAGFIMADGNIRKTGVSSRLSIKIHKKDRKHLERFARDIGSTIDRVKVYPNKPNMVDINFSHPNLLPSLARWGIIPNKTYVFKEAPLSLSKSLLRRFLIGWYDGDGYTVFSKGGNGRFQMTGSHEGMRLFGKLIRQIGYKGGYKVQDCGTFARLIIGGRQQIKHLVFDALRPYKCKRRLHRKWNKIFNHYNRYT